MSVVRKTVLITGASRGLGLALARYFWDRGANLILVSKNSALLHHALDGLTVRHGQKADYLPCDLANEDSLAELVAQVNGRKIDAVINNAAIQGPIGPLSTNSWDQWTHTIQVNLLAPVFICRAVVPMMLSQNTGGAIINLSGGGATAPRANFSAYATAKAGLVRFTETLAEELKQSRIRVNCVAPGPMPTDMLREVINVGHDIAGTKEVQVAEKVVSQYVTSFVRVAELCEFLILDKSKEISGKLISAIWDPWEDFVEYATELKQSEICTLRRIVPADRGQSWEAFGCGTKTPHTNSKPGINAGNPC
jgi:NAD(P)-dependent dehydrogenase (short-subunit alcohol dehydrogenase family)